MAYQQQGAATLTPEGRAIATFFGKSSDVRPTTATAENIAGITDREKQLATGCICYKMDTKEVDMLYVDDQQTHDWVAQ
jgi:hypothetical protein